MPFMKAQELIHYRDYIKSEYWAARKRLYFETHPRACAVCGHPDVDLHHLRYGSYGQESDGDLTALCRYHHGELHEIINVRKDMSYQSRHVVELMKEEWEREKSPAEAEEPAGSTASVRNLELFVQELARPIWYLIDRILRR